jgi:predicted nucleic-acid-binding protein
MIAIDTNVLLRYVLRDDEKQAQIAYKIIHGQQVVLILDMVLVEMAWTLRGSRFDLSREEIADTVLALLDDTNLVFENKDAVWQAAVDYRNAERVKVGKKWKIADFPDALMANKARGVAEEMDERFNGAYAFDKAAQALPDVKAAEKFKALKVIR